jgi:hypothetical protein
MLYIKGELYGPQCNASDVDPVWCLSFQEQSNRNTVYRKSVKLLQKISNLCKYNVHVLCCNFEALQVTCNDLVTFLSN